MEVIETVMTYDEWVKLNNQKQRIARKHKREMLKQKIIGLVCIIIGFASVPFLEGDGSGFLFFVAVGIYLVCAKRKAFDMNKSF